MNHIISAACQAHELSCESWEVTAKKDGLTKNVHDLTHSLLQQCLEVVWPFDSETGLM